MSSNNKLVLVIGGTGAQGLAVVDALLAPSKDGRESPYRVRVLTRNAAHRRSQELSNKGVELVEGSFTDFDAVKQALDGCYGVFVNTDTWAVGEEKEMYVGVRIFEIAKAIPTLRHYVWSNLTYVTKAGRYNPEYRAVHLDAKARVGDWLKAQPSIVSDSELSWTSLTTGPYFETLNIPLWGVMNKRTDGTSVFAAPIGDGHVPFVSLADIGFFARYIFDHREQTSTQDLVVASDVVSMEQIVEAFQKVTGQKAVYERMSIDEWWGYWDDINEPLVYGTERGKGAITVRENFTAFLKLFRDDIVKRDLNWVKSIHPGVQSVEDWMRAVGYTGQPDPAALKGGEDGLRGWMPNAEKAALL